MLAHHTLAIAHSRRGAHTGPVLFNSLQRRRSFRERVQQWPVDSSEMLSMRTGRSTRLFRYNQVSSRRPRTRASIPIRKIERPRVAFDWATHSDHRSQAQAQNTWASMHKLSVAMHGPRVLAKQMRHQLMRAASTEEATLDHMDHLKPCWDALNQKTLKRSSPLSKAHHCAGILSTLAADATKVTGSRDPSSRRKPLADLEPLEPGEANASHLFATAHRLDLDVICDLGSDPSGAGSTHRDPHDMKLPLKAAAKRPRTTCIPPSKSKVFRTLPLAPPELDFEKLYSLRSGLNFRATKSMLAPCTSDRHDALDARALDAPMGSYSDSGKRFELQASFPEDTPWSYTMYRNNEQIRPSVYYCTDIEHAEECLQRLDGATVLGLDLEWVMGSSRRVKDRVSLIQLASEDCIVLLHLALFPGDTVEELVPRTLREILKAPDVLKSGVNIAGDVKRLRDDLNLVVNGVLELSRLHNTVNGILTSKGLTSRRLKALDKLIKQYTGFNMDKTDDVRRGDWRQPLDESQILYAASDAYAGPVLFNILERRRRAMDPEPELPLLSAIDVNTQQAEIDEVEDVGDGTAATSTNVRHANDAHDAIPQHKSPETSRDMTISRRDLVSVLAQSFGPSAVPINPPSPSHVDLQASRQHQRARVWADSYLALHKGSRVPQSHLIAYALWHRESIAVQSVIATMKSSVQRSTMSTYILKAIVLERLEWNAERLKTVFGYAGQMGQAAIFARLRQQMRHRLELQQQQQQHQRQGAADDGEGSSGKNTEAVSTRQRKGDDEGRWSYDEMWDAVEEIEQKQ